MKKSIVKRMTAAALTALMLPTLPLSAHAEEEIVKNFEYFQSLSDYEVYAEYYKTYTELGFKFGEILDRVPTDPLETPHYGAMHEYMTVANTDRPTIEYYVDCTAECKLDLQEYEEAYYSSNYDPDGDGFFSGPGWLEDSPEFFGFPEEWGEKIVFIQATESWYDPETSSQQDFEFYIEVVPYGLSKKLLDYDEYMYQQDVFDAYRITLTLQNSEFWETYGVEGKCILPPFREGYSVTAPFFGDSNRDGDINANDASVVLMNAALGGCGSGDNTPEEIFEQTSCDVTVSNLDGSEYVDAKDAAILLSYAAAVGTGSKASLREYIEQNAETNE